MSLLSALYTGVSGLQTFGDSLQVIGDNIANVNTIAFKASRAEFSDLLSQSINGSAGRSQLGRGVSLERISANFAQGNFSNTDRLTDLAIEGNGFFIVNDGQRNYYTRNGQLSLNAQGELTTNRGLNLMGFTFDSQGVLQRELVPLKIQNDSIPPRQTNGVDVRLNLTSQVPATEIFTFDPANPVSTSNYSTSLTVYDSQGTAHSLTVYFNKVSNNNWEWHAMEDGGEVGGTEGEPFEGAAGSLVFNENGALVSDETITNVGFNFQGTAQTIGFNFGTSIAEGGNGLDGSTQYDQPSQVYTQTQDGFGAGSLRSITINDEGVIDGIYSNGQTIPIGQITLANFANLQGLYKFGAGIYANTAESGQPIIDTPNVGGFGAIASYSLELSNVDLATEFVNLISTQRAYQANSKVITVGDQLMAEVVNIIR
ncbi:MAG TPA: flagellar hook protein FlgE [Candidatus Sumerlaeota bacterium]|nr:flagellar hook protein FlgE [Candidatus Sumerlaeota bacterium]